MNKNTGLMVSGILVMMLIVSCAATAPKDQSKQLPASGSIRSPDQLMFALQKRLELSEEQQSQIASIIWDFALKQDDLIHKYRSQDMRMMAGEMMSLRTDIENRLAEFLTEEQVQEFRKMLEEAQRRPENGPPGGRRAGRGSGQFSGGF